MDTKLNHQEFPIPITEKDVFTFLDQMVAHNGRTPDVMDKALVLVHVPHVPVPERARCRRQRLQHGQVSPARRKWCLANPSLDWHRLGIL